MILMKNGEDLYQDLVKAGISEEEIDKEVKQKVREYEGFLTQEGALFLIAKDIGIDISSFHDGPYIIESSEDDIDYNEFIVPIKNVVEGMTNLVINGRIDTIYRLNSFPRKDGTFGLVGSFLLYDNTGYIKVVIWGRQAEIIENHLFQVGEIVQIVNGYSKMNKNRIEIHVSESGKVILAPESIGEKDIILKNKKILENSYFTRPCIKELHNKEGYIRSISGLAQYENFKELKSESKGILFLLRLILIDNTSSIPINMWGNDAISYFSRFHSDGKLKAHKSILFNVEVKYNKYTNQNEIYFKKNSKIEFLEE